MITEPEFDGGSSGLPGPEALEGAEGAGGPQGHEGYGGSARPGRRPWRWALGGALLASALWAGAWWAATPQDHRPPLRYALPLSLCDQAKLPAVGRLAERIAWDQTPRLWEHPGVDRAMCMLSTPPIDAEVPTRWLAYQAQVSMELHKRVDPAAEFGADPGGGGWGDLGRPDFRSVPGLGEQALISETEYGSGWRLTVLDGGAVFTMDVSVWSGGEGEPVSGEAAPQDPPKPDADAVQAAMIEDMHALMKALHT
ncbi:hypothetical protein [Streptomyces sp. TBY4]|uniref:hypothetical protein n=1 Tax=Streptomyces sp. TBY4 TaxID=2962030 RepID=UPI0020B6B5E0|nr:hypothetical protein [Streptomyces sp. TBY4]MCP3755691.1 hypothetical protein [Streptomyces sp. TBY4]